MTILYKNHQWEVTSYGLEARKPQAPYEIAAKRLSETVSYPARTFYSWPVHMAEKTWVDRDAFNQAFTKALELHAGKYDPPLDQEMLEASIIQSFKEVR